MCIIFFLCRFLIEIIKTKKFEGISVPAIYHDFQLSVVKLIVCYAFNARYLDRVVALMNSDCAVKANENTVVYAHVIWAIPAAVKTVIVSIVSH